MTYGGSDAVRSPYEDALGASLNGLHPRLRAYFSAIPRGSVGIGSGVFDAVGTPKRWLWPLLRLFSGEQIMFPLWRRAVPFTVVNRPSTGLDGTPAVSATRTFRFADGEQVMVDLITSGEAGSGIVVDDLGRSGRVVSILEASVADGALRLRSTAVTIRIMGLALRIPSGLAPVVTLHERWDERTEEQCVAVVVEAPVLGRLYEYAGRFTYAIRPGEATP